MYKYIAESLAATLIIMLFDQTAISVDEIIIILDEKHNFIRYREYKSSK